jgi:hypothetical protein
MVTHATATDTRNPHYQALKGRIHQDVLNRLNLDQLNRTSRTEAEPEIRSVIQGQRRLSWYGHRLSHENVYGWNLRVFGRGEWHAHEQSKCGRLPARGLRRNGHGDDRTRCRGYTR